MATITPDQLVEQAINNCKSPVIATNANWENTTFKQELECSIDGIKFSITISAYTENKVSRATVNNGKICTNTEALAKQIDITCLSKLIVINNAINTFVKRIQKDMEIIQ